MPQSSFTVETKKASKEKTSYGIFKDATEFVPSGDEEGFKREDLL